MDHLKQHEIETKKYVDGQLQELEARITGKLTQQSIEINRVVDTVEKTTTETKSNTTEMNKLNRQLA